MSLILTTYLLFLLIGGLIGYKRGLLKETYTFTVFILSSFAGYIVYRFANININIPILNELKIPLASKITEVAGKVSLGLIAYIIATIILSVIKKTLIENEFLPEKKFPKFLGSMFNILVLSVVFSFLAVPFNLDINYEDFSGIEDHQDSVNDLSFLVNLNPISKRIKQDINSTISALYALSEGLNPVSIHEIDLTKLTVAQKEGLRSVMESETAIKFVKEAVIANMGSNYNFDKEIIVTKEQIEQIKDLEEVSVVYEMYQEGLITETLIKNVITELNIKGINFEEVIEFLESYNN